MSAYETAMIDNATLVLRPCELMSDHESTFSTVNFRICYSKTDTQVIHLVH